MFNHFFLQKLYENIKFCFENRSLLHICNDKGQSEPESLLKAIIQTTIYMAGRGYQI